MIPKRHEIWTPRGYLEVNDCAVGDKVLSYNPERNCLEEDHISYIETNYGARGLMGPNRSTYKFWLTPDHEVFLWNKKENRSRRVRINDVFCQSLKGNDRLMGMRPYEPYLRTKPIEDIEWSARMAASYRRNKLYPKYYWQIWDKIKDMSGYEAQVWAHTFFNWGKLQGLRPQYDKTILMYSPWILKMLYHSIPRAGRGTHWHQMLISKRISTQAFSMLLDNDGVHLRLQWAAHRKEELVYNIATKNGSFLGKYMGGTYIFTCKYTE